MNLHRLVGASAIAIVLSTSTGGAQTSEVARIYVFDCGQAHTPDQSRWSPGVHVGVAIELSDNCYLIRHAQGNLLWDTGLPDALADQPPPAPDPSNPVWQRSKKLATQLDAVGVKPSDIKFLGISHTHPDHTGNVEMFPQAMLLVQKAEYDWPTPNGQPRFKPDHPVTKLEGDRDLFGDGSVTLISTPGHTPGHQSLLVKLKNTGAVLLTGMRCILGIIGITGAHRVSTTAWSRRSHRYNA
jgi:N-acyl homoserine lactone hydrolase